MGNGKRNSQILKRKPYEKEQEKRDEKKSRLKIRKIGNSVEYERKKKKSAMLSSS